MLRTGGCRVHMLVTVMWSPLYIDLGGTLPYVRVPMVWLASLGGLAPLK